MDPKNDVQPQTPTTDDEDVEGHAFKWAAETDPKSGTKRLRAGWSPDDPSTGRTRSPQLDRKEPGSR
jgi:hypothetical protein